MLNFPPQDHWQEFYDWFENNTRGFEIDLLGYPWYRAAKEIIDNSNIAETEKRSNQNIDQKRLEDFTQKVELLNKTFDLVFITRASMRSYDQNSVEYPDVYEVLKFAEQQGRSFLIIEYPERNEVTDLKYLSSEYASVTIPWEHLFNAFDKTQMAPIQGHYKELVEKAFSNISCPPEFEERLAKLRNKLLEMNGRVSQLMVTQSVVAAVEAKATFGGMMTQHFAGLAGPHKNVELLHGCNGRWEYRELLHFPVNKYYQEKLRLDLHYALGQSGNSQIAKLDLFPDENYFNFGLPSLRRYEQSEEREEAFKTKYSLHGKSIILIATTGWNDISLTHKLINEISTQIPNSAVIVRPHPRFDSHKNHEAYKGEVHFLPFEDKYDSISIADVVISAPSTFVIESSKFTDNVICHPNSVFPSRGTRIVEANFPMAKAIHPTAIPQFIDTIKSMLKKPSRKRPQEHEVDYKAELSRLFKSIFP